MNPGGTETPNQRAPASDRDLPNCPDRGLATEPRGQGELISQAGHDTELGARGRGAKDQKGRQSPQETSQPRIGQHPEGQQAPEIGAQALIIGGGEAQEGNCRASGGPARGGTP